MTGFGASLRRELTGQWRTRRVLVVGSMLLVFGLLSPLLARATPEIVRLMPHGDEMAAAIPEPTVEDAIGQTVKNLSQVGALLAILTVMGLAARERERGVAALLLGKPLTRGAWLLSKLAAASIVFAGALALASGGAWLYSALLFGAPGVIGWIVLTALLFVLVAFHLAIALAASAMTKSVAVAGGAAAGVSLLVALVGSVPGLARYLPAGLLAWARSAASGASTPAVPALLTTLALTAAALTLAQITLCRAEL